MAGEEASTVKVSLLNLPTELRLMIYDYVLGDEPAFVRPLCQHVCLMSHDFDYEALSLRWICHKIRDEINDHVFREVDITLKTENHEFDVYTHKSIIPDSIPTPELSFLSEIQDLSLAVILDSQTFTCSLRSAENILLKLNTSAALGSFQVKFEVSILEPELAAPAQRTKIHAKLIMCRMKTTRETRERGLSQVKSEMEFGFKAVELLKKVKAHSDWTFAETV